VQKVDLITSEYIFNVTNNLNFLCLTETHTKTDSMLSFNFPGFKLGASYSRVTRKGGGVGLWFRSGLNVIELDLRKYCSEQIIEICGVLWKPTRDTNIIILVCYRSPGVTNTLFYSNMELVLESTFQPNVSFLLCGDFNLDPNRDSREYRLLTQLLSTYNISNIISRPTRLNRSIDHIFSNFTASGFDILDNIISDHRTVLLNSGIACEKKQHVAKFNRNFNSDSVAKFLNDLEQNNWDYLFVQTDINTAFKHFYDIYNHYFNLHFPKIKIYFKEKKKWITGEIIQSSINLKNLHSLKTTYPEFNNIYKDAKKNHNHLIRESKMIYYQNLIINSDNVIKSAWQVIKDISNKKREFKNLVINYNGQTVDDPQTTADLFNEYFKEAPKNVVQQISTTNSINLLPKFQDKSVFLLPFVEHELLTLLNNKLKNNFSSGPDDIPSFLIKLSLSVLGSQLTFLINLSFQTGCFPNCLKVGNISPIHKKDDPTNIANYRPITLTSGFSKIFEYAYLNRIESFLNVCKTLSDNQHGFRSNHSTMTAVNSFYNKIICHLENGECPAGIFCDLSRAFDCVSHNTLLLKAERYGIRGNALDWLQSFLIGRQQFVSINKLYNNTIYTSKSNYLDIDLGVPQGSVLGPVLFLLYINDLEMYLNNELSCTLYADDTSIILSDKDSSLLTTKCNLNLNKLVEWFNSNSLYLNKSKTHNIRFHNYQNT